MGFGIWRHKQQERIVSLPDHGEYDHIADTGKLIPERNLINMGMTFLSLYLEDGDKRNFDAGLTILGRAYQRTEARGSYAAKLKEEIEAAAAPIGAREPHFCDRVEPGQVVAMPLHPPLINPLPRPDELDE